GDGAAKPEPRLVTVPDLGDFSDVAVIEVLVAAGDRAQAEQGLLTLETEKATMDVPAQEAGPGVELKVKAGDRVSTGDAVILLEPDQAAAAKPAEAAPAAATGETPRAPATPRPEPPLPVFRAPTAAIDEASFSRAHASPSVRKLARELGVDLGRGQGSGRKGRVTADDVKAFVKHVMQSGGAGQALPAVPTVDFAKFGRVETVPLSRIQRVAGPRLHASWVNLPHVTQHDEADITELEET